ncbi:hypothetical protein C8F01DRAFT_1370420 [Mycena amicta]|nr:hypothetical protein C8F01DRAFT_1370420 [Mycena amicta]
MSKNDPHFPPELEREIFETAAEMHWKDVPDLRLVARRVHEWLEPFLYRNIYLGDSKESDILMQEAFLNLVAAKSPEFLARAVRRVTMQFDAIPLESELLKIYYGLRLCTGITGLAFGGNDDAFIGKMVPLLAHMRLQRLPEEDSELIQLLVTLPALTHLSLNSAAPHWPFVKDLLDRCRRLEILVFLVGDSGQPPLRLVPIPVQVL